MDGLNIMNLVLSIAGLCVMIFLCIFMIVSILKVFNYTILIFRDPGNDLWHGFNPFNNIFSSKNLSEASIRYRKVLVKWLMLFVVSSVTAFYLDHLLFL